MADDRRSRFIDEYLKDLNATQAAIRAGYSARSATVTSTRLLANASLRTKIDARLAKIAAKAEITVERTLREIARIAYGDHRKLYGEDGSLLPVRDMDDDAAALIASIEIESRREGRGEDAEVITVTKVKRWDKTRALTQCMEYLGMIKQRVEHVDAEGKPLPVVQITFVRK